MDEHKITNDVDDPKVTAVSETGSDVDHHAHSHKPSHLHTFN